MSGGRKQLIAFCIAGGLLLGLSQPVVIASISRSPLDPSGASGLLALFAYVFPLLALRRSSGFRSAVALGFVTSFVQLLIIANWIVLAFTEYAGMSFVVGFSIGLIIAGTLALCLAVIAFGGAYHLSARLHLPLWVTFPLALTAAELFRNQAPYGGDPWGNVGMSMVTIAVLRQAASVVGVYGLVFLVAVVNAATAELIAARLEHRRTSRRALIFGSLAVFLWVGYGTVRLRDPTGSGERIRVGILQGAIDQHIVNDPKADPAQVRAVFHGLQTEALAAGAEVIVWPEAALIPAIDRATPDLTAAGILPGTSTNAYQGPLPQAAIVGAMTLFGTKDEGQDVVRVNETAFVTGPGFLVRGRFTKARLVPLGEYLPWPFDLVAERLVNTPYKLEAGTEQEPVVLKLPKRSLSVGATLCFEGIFPEIHRAFVKKGADLMFNLTNDAWFGISSGPYQHALMYSMRATETGTPLIRAANAGISAWYDTRGRMFQATELFERKALIVDVPLGAELTPYTLLGEWVAVLCSLAMGVLLIYAHRPRATRPKTP